MIFMMYNLHITIKGEYKMKRNLKKLLGLVMILTLGISMVGCGANPKTPEGTVKTALDKLYKGDSVVWKEIIIGKKLSAEEKKQLKEREKKDKDPQFEKIKEFKYKVLESKKSKDSKSVDVKVEFETYDFVKAHKDMQEYFMKNQSKLAKLNEKDLKKTIDEQVAKNLKKAKKVKNKSIIHTELDKKSKEYKVVNLDSNIEFQNAITGGLVKYKIEQTKKYQQQIQKNGGTNE